MAAMTGAEFRRRDACQARGPVVSTTGCERLVDHGEIEHEEGEVGTPRGGMNERGEVES